MMNEHCQCWKNITNHVHGWRWIFVAAQVHHDPRDVPQERQRNIGIDEGDKRLDNAKADDIITALWAVTYAYQHNVQQLTS